MKALSLFKPMKSLTAFFVLALPALAFLCASCETLDSLEDDDKPQSKAQYVISIHDIVKYPRAEQLEMNISSFSGAPICVNANPFLHSRNITKIELVEEKDKPGFYDLKLTLDRRGKLLWTSLSMNFRNSQLAFVIDGVCYRCFTPEVVESDEDMVATIKGPFDVATANALKKNAEKNYKIFSKDEKNK